MIAFDEAVMGLVTSCCGRRPNKSRLHNQDERVEYKKGKRMVSASYNAREFDMSFNQMNINEASEEELMTLEGITRNVARNIISYRHHIGGFRKTEDLVLVTGIGASKLEAFRTEIYCGPYAVMPFTNRVSSRTSYHRVNSRNSVENKVNVNTATVPALAKIASIGHDLAELIVKYREEHGLFQLLTDVSRIPEVGSYRFELMRNHLMLNESSESTVSTPSFLEMRRPLCSEEETSVGIEALRFVGVSHVGMQVNQSTQTDEVFLPLIMMSMEAWARPVVSPSLSEEDGDGRSRFRIGTWNLQQFTKDKAENLGVKEVICMTVLENRLSMLAVQELADRDALAIICSELNDPTLAVVRNWPTPRGIWKCVTSDPAGRMFQGVEYNGFLWNTSDGVTLAESILLQSPKRGTNGRHFVRKPFLGYFKAQELDLVVISVHLKFPGLANGSIAKLEEEISQLTVLSEALKEQLSDEKDVLILGDFNSSPSAPEFKALTAAGFSHTLTENTYTNISTKNPTGSHCYDNAWFSKSLHKMYTGESHVVRKGLTHPLIPDNWSWGGVASDHCPVWVEFYSDSDLDKGVLADLSKVRLLP